MQTSADVVLLSATAVTARDLAPPLLGRPLPLAAARFLPPVFGALGLATALSLDRDVLETLKLGYSIFAAGLILPVLAAFLPGRLRIPARRGHRRDDRGRRHRGRGPLRAGPLRRMGSGDRGNWR